MQELELENLSKEELETINQSISYLLQNIKNDGCLPNVNLDLMLNRSMDSKINDALYLLNITLTPNGYLFDNFQKGFMPEIIERMFIDRQNFKKQMIEAEKELEAYKGNDQKIITEIKNRIAKFNNLQASKKIELNSLYGSLGNEYSRFFDVRIAEAITTGGQLSIKWIMNAINGYINKLMETINVDYIIAVDTDSVYINFSPLVDKVFANKEKSSVSTNQIVDFLDKACKTQIQPFIDKSYQELAIYVNAYAQEMIMKREKIISPGIAVAGKNYIWNVYDSEGVRYKEPQIKVVGLKMIKSNTPEAARKKLKDILKLIVNDKEEDLHKFVAQFKQEFMQLPIEDIATPTGMNGLLQYADEKTIYKKGSTIHIKGSLLYNHRLKELGLDKKYPFIHDGERVKYTYLKMPNPLKDEVISFPNVLPPEMKLYNYVDREKQFDKAFVSPLEAVLNVIGWKIEEQNSLEGFMG